jgi:hypothetical protein
MGTMSASDAAPLPRLGEVFFDVRGDSRTMRVSWYADTGVAVFSIWQGDTCTGTFRLPIPELPRMVEALTQGPPGRAESAAQTRLDRGPSDLLPAGYPGFAPGGDYPDARPGPGRDFPHQHDYGAPHAGYAAAAPTGYQAGPPTARFGDAGPGAYQEGPSTARFGDAGPGAHQEGPSTARYGDAGPGGHQGPPPGGQHQAGQPADGFYQGPAPEGHHDLPPGGYFQGPAPDRHRDLPSAGQARSAAGGYQDPGYRDAPPGSSEGTGSAAPGGYQELPPGSYRDLAPGSGYGDVPPGAGYRAPDEGYWGPPAAAPAEGPAQFAGRGQDPYPPTGPLPVGRWHTDTPSDEFPQARPEEGFAPHTFAEDRPPSDTFAADTFAADTFAPDGYAGGGFTQDEFAADRFPDDPLADSYQGEAEQGYLPSPPTDTFPAASLSDYRDQGSRPAGHEPDPADLGHESPYPAGRAGRGGPARDPDAYRPGQGGAQEREYGQARGRS